MDGFNCTRVIDLITVKKAAEELGTTTAAIRGKIQRKQWRDGIEYIKGPDRRIYISRTAVTEWIHGQEPF